MVHGNIEEALDLLRVEVHRQDTVDPGGHEQVGHQLGGNRHARLVFTVLPRVTVKRQHGGDPVRARPPQRVYHDEHLHQMMVRRGAGGLHHEHILPAHVLLDFHERLAVWEGLDSRFAQLDANVGADGLSQGLIGTAAKNLHRT